jgi:hypothetical protein
MIEYRREVDDLLTAYGEYKQLLQVEADLSMKVAKQKISGSIDAELNSKHTQIKQALQDLSDSMRFSNPFVWIMYKYEAYQNEAQPIRTLRDFRLHCSKDGYICTKRFMFLNEQLALKGHRSLMLIDYYHDDMLLNELLEENSLQELMQDPGFITLWQHHEYTTVDGRVAKWEGYSAAA